jgi:hypothetical protein
MSSSGSNSAAIKLQRESLDEQKRANAAQLEFLARQTEALRKQVLPAYKPGSPAPTAATAGTDYASAQERLAQQRRFGYADTIYGGAMRSGVAA